MLLFIALANVWGWLYGRDVGFATRPVDSSVLDRVLDGIVAFAVDDRSRPMFAILLGWGIATIAARSARSGLGVPGTRALLARRSGWLVVFGLVHAALLFGGDILLLYGMTGLVALFLVHHRSRVLVWWLGASTVGFTGVFTLLWFLGGWGSRTGEPEPVPVPSGYLTTLWQNPVSDLALGVLGVLTLAFVGQVVIGFFLHRAGWLDHPGEHRAALRRVVLVGAVVNVCGSLPYALAAAGVWTPTGTANLATQLAHVLSGIVVGLGYICFFALVASYADQWRGAVARRASFALRAVGERSLSCYLAQSMIMAPVLGVWGLGLGGRLGTAQAYAFAAMTWVVTVLLAVLLARAGRQGPFEVLLRRLTYGRRDRVARIPLSAAPAPAAAPATGS